MTDQFSLREVQHIELQILKKVTEICDRHAIDYWIDCGTLLGAVRHKGFIPWDDDMDIAMLRDDYERFVKVAPAELGDEFFLQTRKTDPNYPFTFDKVRKNNTTFVEWATRGLDMHHGIYIDIFVYDKLPEYGTDRYLDECLALDRKTIRKYVPTVDKAPAFTKDYLIGLLKKKLAYIYYMFKSSEALDRELLELFTKYRNVSYDNIKYTCLSFREKDIFYHHDIFPTQPIEFEGFTFKAPNNPDKYLKVFYNDYMQIPAEEDRAGHVPAQVNTHRGYDAKKDAFFKTPKF
ncbi:LicD family protein [Allofustis seminis]|uniref:LicD family protein n=1 Tax=Allofustis seminis TaxID=166939 RepID=UPI00036CDD84|nr:LicD family protein [Allofustis seminis]